MDTVQAIVLGIVQGLTEFLPVSSSGHLVLFQKIVGIKEHSLVFDVAVHLGTLLTVLTIYWRTIRAVIVDVVRYPVERKMTFGLKLFLLVCVGSVPTGIIGFTLKDYFEQMFSSIPTVAMFLSITGFLLFMTRRKAKGRFADATRNYSLEQLKNLSFPRAFIIGISQGAAIAPGISRSGTTIATGIFLGVERQVAALFSFMLSVPAILGAGVLQLKDVTHWDPGAVTTLLVGLFVAYGAGLVGLWAVLRFVKQGRLELFSYYLWTVALVSLFVL